MEQVYDNTQSKGTRMTKDEALKMALEALESNKQKHNYCEDTWYSCPKHEDGCANEAQGAECNCGADEINAQFDKAITAIKESLAQPEQKYHRGDRLICLETEEYCVIHISGTDRQWVKFPDSHIGVYTNEQVAELFELLLKEPEQETNKNGSPCPEFWDWLPKAYNFEGDGNFTKYNMEVAFLAGKQASQPEQAPVAWMSKDADIVYTSIEVYGYFQHDHIPLYTIPPRKAGEK